MFYVSLMVLKTLTCLNLGCINKTIYAILCGKYLRVILTLWELYFICYLYPLTYAYNFHLLFCTIVQKRWGEQEPRQWLWEWRKGGRVTKHVSKKQTLCFLVRPFFSYSLFSSFSPPAFEPHSPCLHTVHHLLAVGLN